MLRFGPLQAVVRWWLAVCLSALVVLWALSATRLSASVLVIGDSVSLGWMPHAQQLLPEVEFVHASNRGGLNNYGTKYALAQALGEPARRIDVYVESPEPWDLIIYNSGIHDMRTGSWNGTTADQYRSNLNKIYDVLETQGAPILWLTTTPVPDDTDVTDPTLQYSHRAAAIEVANQRADGVLDLFAAVYDDFPQYQLEPQDLHFNAAGSEFLASLIVDAVAAPQVATENYYIDGTAPLWPEGIFNPYVEPEVEPPQLFDGQDFLIWQRNFQHPLSGSAEQPMAGDEFLAWQRVEGSRPLYKRSPIHGRDFLNWQRHESELQRGEEGAFVSSDFLSWQRVGSRAFEGVLGPVSNGGGEAAVSVPEPTGCVLLLLGSWLVTTRSYAR